MSTDPTTATAMLDSAQAIASLAPWFHNLHLPDGRQTAPDHWLGDFPAFKWRQIAPHLPDDLRGWTALDIGCNAGFYSIELARRGAAVRAVDSDPHYLRQARWAARQYDLAGTIDFDQLQVYDLARRGERFDLVLFMGVLYHLRYPLLGLEVAARCTSRLMVFQSLALADANPSAVPSDLTLSQRAALSALGWPRMAFVEKRLQHDPTNWWVPNTACVEAMLRSAGLRVIAAPADETYLCEPGQSSSEVPDQDERQYRSALGLSAEQRGRTNHEPSTPARCSARRNASSQGNAEREDAA